MEKADSKRVLTGSHYLDGDHACTEGALAAGCNFIAGYPITPSTEVVERYSRRIPAIGGTFIQMEDEIASITAVLGAVWGGAKAMTVTSGPGFSLMMENIGLAAMLETPCVIVNVMRGGPSTGLPTMVGQADVMQARWGSHGDYEIIALAPQSPQEAFTLMIDAFNLAERYRLPVMVMLDECIGHMTEKVVIPEACEIEIRPRRISTKEKGEYLPYEIGADMVPDMAHAGEGHRYHITGLTHDERGYPAMDAEVHDKLVRRLCDKVREQADDIIMLDEDGMDGAEIVLISYGITSRVARASIEATRAAGIKVGSLRLQTLWPFPEKRIGELAGKVKAFVVPEVNYGQISLEVERCAAGRAQTLLVPHMGGGVHDPAVITRAIEEAAK
ncbi:MAG: 2-oxoacid:acceptor oxidoreductase subunit alpha [bacterium]|nr:2-oxoacid:acceptor oxidoreductase subunit alpha [bacterium]